MGQVTPTSPPTEAVEAAARALREHSTWSADLRAGEGFRCICGADGPEFGRIEGWECHQAEAVAAAVVAALDLPAREREAAAKGWDEGQRDAADGFMAGMLAQSRGEPCPEGKRNPYRASALREGRQP